MPDYSFANLSTFDFELLVRDLLQADRSLRLEAFGPGPDQGIDLRCASGSDGALIVQCKHKPSSKQADVVRTFQQEVSKVTKLAPRQYIAATSASLTPNRKTEVEQLFKPYCLSTDDVIAREDINGLLSRHPEVEKAHFKLWLASTAVLERLLNARLYGETAAEVERIRMRISLYVTNPSVQRAQEILEANHYCIVAGNPGIGKTTLAEILLANYAREGYELFKLRDDVAEAREVFKPERRQVFYYDDFLGSTTFKEFSGKNEDEVLVRFLEEVSRSPNTRFILTTREYILNQGRQESERLADLALDPAKCVVDLGDYTRGVRAEILYNHLHFSNLPVAYKEALVLNKNYLRIINHKNYSPRIIERMTGYLNVADIRPENFFAEFMLNLENPKRIWEHAFMNYILPASQDLLLCLSSLPDLVDHEDLKEVFESFRAYRAAKYRIELSQYDFTRALKELEGGFIANSHKDGRYLCRFHNPSIRDFLEAHLVGNEVNVQDLLASSSRVEQPHRLVKVVHKLAPAERPKVFEALVRAFHRQFTNVRQCHGVVAASVHWIARLDICAAIFPLKSIVITDVARAEVLSMAGALGEEISQLHTSWLLVHFVNRLKVAETHDWYPKDKLFTNATASAIKALQSGEAEMATFKVLSELLEKHGEQLPTEFRSDLTDLFRSNVESELDHARALFSGGDPEPMLKQIDDLEDVAIRLGIDIDMDVQEVRELADSLIVSEEPLEDSGQVFTVRSDEGDDRIDSMFQVLLDQD